MNDNQLLAGGGELLQPQLEMDVRLLADRSGSIRDYRLVEPMRATLAAMETGLAELPRARISRSMFSHVQQDLERPNVFLRGPQIGERPFAEVYKVKGATHLERILNDEIGFLLKRFDKDPSRLHVLWLFTDGEDTGGRRDKRAPEIRRKMAQVIERAQRTGGITSSHIVVFFVGLGFTRDRYFEVACNQFGIPDEWLLWKEATAAGVRDMGTMSSQVFDGMSSGGGTVFSRVDPNDDPWKDLEK